MAFLLTNFSAIRKPKKIDVRYWRYTARPYLHIWSSITRKDAAYRKGTKNLHIRVYTKRVAQVNAPGLVIPFTQYRITLRGTK